MRGAHCCCRCIKQSPVLTTGIAWRMPGRGKCTRVHQLELMGPGFQGSYPRIISTRHKMPTKDPTTVHTAIPLVFPTRPLPFPVPCRVGLYTGPRLPNMTPTNCCTDKVQSYDIDGFCQVYSDRGGFESAYKESCTARKEFQGTLTKNRIQQTTNFEVECKPPKLVDPCGGY